MSFWDERVIGHRIIEDIRIAKTKIEETDLTKIGNDLVAWEAKARLLAVVDRLQKRLSVVDPYFVPLKVLEDISDSLNTIVQCLEAFHADPEIGHLTRANAAADNILSHLSLLWFPRTTEEVGDLELAAVSLRKTLEEHSRNLLSQLEEISAESSRLAADLSALKRQIAEQRSQIEADRTDLLANKEPPGIR